MVATSTGRIAGLRGISEALRAERFPIDKQGLYYTIGDIEIPLPEGGRIAARDLLDAVNERSFSSLDAVLTAVRTALEQHALKRASR
jgi:hypothetical protein